MLSQTHLKTPALVLASTNPGCKRLVCDSAVTPLPASVPPKVGITMLPTVRGVVEPARTLIWRSTPLFGGDLLASWPPTSSVAESLSAATIRTQVAWNCMSSTAADKSSGTGSVAAELRSNFTTCTHGIKQGLQDHVMQHNMESRRVNT